MSNDSESCGYYFCGYCGCILEEGEDIFCADCEREMDSDNILEPTDDSFLFDGPFDYE
jgi:hypothetical protein